MEMGSMANKLDVFAFSFVNLLRVFIFNEQQTPLFHEKAKSVDEFIPPLGATGR
ncbi:MAG: hypothetical protein J5I98_26565 [Phaeodactylibacter sp.]|nr:hypothetical protein [Phaeodactylibacter sp.]